jgi:hypothetical protein
VRTSTNPTGPEINDHVSLQWLSYEQPQGPNMRLQREQTSWSQILIIGPPPKWFVSILKSYGAWQLNCVFHLAIFFLMTNFMWFKNQPANYCWYVVGWIKKYFVIKKITSTVINFLAWRIFFYYELKRLGK